MKALRILCLFDYKASTGFSTVGRNIISQLKKHYGKDLVLHICAINYFGQIIHEYDDTVTIFSAINSTPRNSMPATKDEHGRNGFLWMLAHSNDDSSVDNCPKELMGYDGIFIIHDPHMANSIVPDLRMIKQTFRKNRRKDFKSLVYFPIDQNIPQDAIISELDFYDTIVTYTEFARKEVLRLRPQWKKKLKVVPHGVNCKEFYQEEDDAKVQAFRKGYFGKNADKFIVVNVNRNQPRKDIPCTIFGFEKYKTEYNPNAFLYLHMNPKDPLGWDLRGVLSQTSLVEGVDFMFPPKSLENHDTAIEVLNLIYNASDVYLTTTLGEGWGLTVTEAMACGTPVICPMHTSLIEIGDVGNRVFPLENLYPICNVSDNTKREQCDFMEVADVLHEVHKSIKNFSYDRILEDEKYLGEPHNKKTNNALLYVGTELDWDIIGKRWIEIFKQTF